MNEPSPEILETMKGMVSFIASYIFSQKVIGWILADNYNSFTTDHLTCAKWHKEGKEVLPVYIRLDKIKP